MVTPPRKPLLETSALIVGYAMSRLDKAYLEAQRVYEAQQAAYAAYYAQQAQQQPGAAQPAAPPAAAATELDADLLEDE